MKKEKANLENEMEELRKNEMEVINENTLLRQKFAECLKKAEDFRDQAKHLADDNTRLKEATEKIQEKLVREQSTER
jgi:regulator of replication initiation timing